MTNVGSSRVFTTLLMVALTGALVQMYRTFLVVPQFQVFALRVVSLFLEALPFLLAGAVVAAIAREILPSEKIVAFCRRHRALGLPAIALAGFVLPMEEFRLPGLARRLRAEGLPVPHLVAALLAIPLLNPVVVASTAIAFPAYPDLVILRFLGGMIVAVMAGAILTAWTPPEKAIDHTAGNPKSPITPSESAAGPDIRGRLDRVVQRGLAGFLTLARYFVVAAVVVGLAQSIELPAYLAPLRSAVIPGTLVAVGLAYLLSVPAVSDAFIARGLLAAFPAPALTGFLIAGPMLNLRNVPMYGRLISTGRLILLHLVVLALAIATALTAALIR